MSLFEIKNCKKNFDGVPVIKDISFKVDEGEVVAIIGSSGSGKTTLLRICTFLEYMNDGEMSYLDTKVVTSENNCAKYIGQKQLSVDALKMNKCNQKILVLTTWLYGNKNTNFSISLANNTIKEDIPDVYFNIIRVAVANARK